MAGNKGGVFSRRKKLIPAPTSQKGLNVNEDRLSSLPDLLINHILSFLNTQEVVKTCALSKRWKFIWTDISMIVFEKSRVDYEKTKLFVDGVSRMLAMCNETCLERFPKGTMYELPRELYLHSSMKSLEISGCKIDPRAVIDWQSLERLYIEDHKDCETGNILSGCPLLVNGMTCFNISSPKLRNGIYKSDTLELEEIQKYFDVPMTRAAKELNVGLTVLKKRCRELNITRWPHRKIQSLKSLIHNVKELGWTNEIEMLEEHIKILETKPEMELTERTRKLRQACFKANYEKRR